MFPFKRKTASDTSTSPELTEEERQRRKKFVIYPLMFLLFAGSMWLIFAPSEKEEEKQVKGFNTEVPDPMAAELIGDKKKAYEKEIMEQKEQERSQAMQSLSSMFGEMTGGQPAQSSEELALKADASERYNGFGSRTTASQAGFHASASAYQDINRTLGNEQRTAVACHNCKRPDGIARKVLSVGGKVYAVGWWTAIFQYDTGIGRRDGFREESGRSHPKREGDSFSRCSCERASGVGSGAADERLDFPLRICQGEKFPISNCYRDSPTDEEKHHISLCA